MATFAKVCIIVLVVFTEKAFGEGEKFQFFLDIVDMMDPSWIYSTYNEVGTKIECAFLCYQDKGSCSYFGYKGETCYLLNDSVDRDLCSLEDCLNSGMKIYKWEQEITTTVPPETTTITDATTTTTTTLATTTRLPETSTTTTEATTTTTTESTTSTTKIITTTGVTTSTTTETTTITDATTTTTTTLATTTRLPETSTTTTEATTTTTTESTTSTTKIITTTGVTTSTTTEPTSSTTEGWNCEPPDGVEGELFCPTNNWLLRAMGTRTPFFSDAVVAACTDMKEQVFNDEEEVHTFFSVDLGLTLNCKCPHEHHVVYKFKLCVKAEHAAAITLHCRLLKDPDRIEDYYNVTSDSMHNLVNCADNGAIQNMYFMDANGDGIITRIVFTCIRVKVEWISCAPRS